MAGGAAEIDEAMEAREVEGGGDGGGAELAEAVHALKKLAERVFGAEEVGEQRAFEAEGLSPAMAAFADGVFQMRPHGIKGGVGVTDVSGERVGRIGAKVLVGDGGVAERVAFFREEAERDAGFEKAGEFLAIGGTRAIEDAESRRRRTWFWSGGTLR